MNDILRAWILGVVGAALITAVALTVTPEGAAKRVTAVVCGFMMIIALIEPIKAFDYERFKLSIAAMNADGDTIAAAAAVTTENLTAAVIRGKYAAYISDKGANLGVSQISAEVEVANKGGVWIPVSAAITTDADEARQSALALAIETDLGLSPREMTWIRSITDES